MAEYIFHVSGMHCTSCVLLIEDEIRQVPGVRSVKAQLANHQVRIEGEFAEADEEAVLNKLAPYFSKIHFTLSRERMAHDAAWHEFVYAVPIAAALLLVFVLLQKMGIVDLFTVTEINLPAAVLLGIIASLSTCMAMVGGLTLSISANYAHAGRRWQPQLLFHAGRLMTFFILGGVLGWLGAGLRIQGTALIILNFAIALTMLLLGLNLLNVVHWSKRLQFTLPPIVSHILLKLRRINNNIIPFLLGGVTFFLPCGFTQSVQLMAVGSGSFWGGSGLMLAFAVGTLPILALLSLATFYLPRGTKTLSFKIAGLVVISFGAFNLFNAAKAAGLL